MNGHHSPASAKVASAVSRRELITASSAEPTVGDVNAPESAATAATEPPLLTQLRIVGFGGSKIYFSRCTLFLATAIIASAAPAAKLLALEAVRVMERNTPLMVNGKSPALLVPDEPGYREAIALLTQGLARVGIKAEAAHDIAAADPAARTVLCLGSMLNNPLIERLYWNRYTFVDALIPGAGNYLLHTVYDPYPFNGGHNVIIIGCNDSAGAVQGVKRFLSLVNDGQLPYVVEAGPQSPVGDAEASRVLTTKPDPTFLELSKNANRYLQTGSEAYARKAIAALELMTKLYEPGGQRGAGTTLAYQRLPFDEEEVSWEINCAWDAFEECPLITDAQRLAFSNVLLKFTRELRQYCSGYEGIDEHYKVSWNHTTFPLLGMHFGARYFDRYYKLPDMRELLAKARMCFTAQARSWKPQEDADQYINYTMEHVAIYGLAENRLDYFASGNLQRFADYIVGICDNRGLSSGFGDSNLGLKPSVPKTALPLALWWSKDGGYRWLMDRYTGNKWQNPYERGVLPVRPDRFTGVNVFAMDAQVYELTQTKPFYSETLMRADVPPAEAFDKITFRENWDVNGQYLILDGMARGKHLHYDGNSIIEFVEGGERWLLDHDYLTRNTTEHTMLSILRNGRCEQLVPSLAGLAASADLPDCGYTRTYMKDYNGCDWQRQILWNKDSWFLVADTVTPPAAGDYTFDLTWKTIDSGGHQHVTKRGDFTAERSAKKAVRQLCINPADTVTSWVSDHERAGITVPVSILHQRKDGAFYAGEAVKFASLMFTSLPGKRRALQPVRLGENLLAVSGTEPALAVLGNVSSHGLDIIAEAGLVTLQRIALSGLREFHAGDLLLHSSAPLDLQLDLTSGHAVAIAPSSGAELTISLASQSQTFSLNAGRQEIGLVNYNGARQTQQLITALTETPTVASLLEPTTESAKTTQPAWSAFDPDKPIACIKTADLGDGKGTRLFVCRNKSLHCLSPEGKLLWSFNTDGRTRDVAFGELRPSAGQEILVGSSDTYIYLLSASGELLEKHQMSGVPYARSFGDRTSEVCHVGVWDIDGDGRNEIIATTLKNYDLQALTGDWQPLWKVHYALHGSMQLSFEDLNGDGKPETILVADKYGNCVGASPEGKVIYRGTTSIGDVACVVTSLDGGKTRHIVSGSSTGDLMATSASSAEKPLWHFDNFGYSVNCLRAADLTGDGRNEVIVASGTGYLYVLDVTGKVLWQDRAGYCVNDAIVIPGSAGMRVAYCDESGPVRIADGRGKLIREFRPPSPARLLTLLPPANGQLLVMALSDGRVAAYDLR